MRRVVLATRSPGKVRELQPLLRDAGFDPTTLADLAVAASLEEEEIERFATFRENAVAKARYFVARCGGLPVIAEDSGLEVAALGGRPGVRSKRWSGRLDVIGEALDAANNAKLVQQIRGVADRSARYVCEAAWADASGVRVARGECAGRIIDTPRGTGGFGYDPYFFATELEQTFGEASLSEKARVSHRARAVRALLEGAPSSRVVPG
jgi:XTP/dITP diphosphohydrolase